MALKCPICRDEDCDDPFLQECRPLVFNPVFKLLKLDVFNYDNKYSCLSVDYTTGKLIIW